MGLPISLYHRKYVMGIVYILRNNYSFILIGVAVLEKLLSNHDLMVKSWRVDHNASYDQIRDHLVHMRIAFVKTSIIFCSRSNTWKILDQVSDFHYRF